MGNLDRGDGISVAVLLEQLEQGSRRWLLFDPDQRWTNSSSTPGAPRAANIPWLGRELQGRVVACGLNC